jgi:hypothetical protein
MLCTNEVGGVKMKGKKNVLQFEKEYFLYCSFLVVSFGFAFQK